MATPSGVVPEAHDAIELAASPAESLTASDPSFNKPGLIERLTKMYTPEAVPHVAHHYVDFWSVKAFEDFLYSLHDAHGLPWWASIVTVTLILRTLIIPVNIRLLRNSMRMKMILPEVDKLNDVMSSKTSSEQEKAKAAADLMSLFQEKNCSPWRNTIIPFFFPPFFLSFFASLHNLCLTEPGMREEGLLWFTDLTSHDPTYFLPVLSGLTWLAAVEVSGCPSLTTSRASSFSLTW